MKLELLQKDQIKQFKTDIQEAFQKGALDYFNHLDVEILPESHIDESLNKKGAIAYGAIENNQLVGGAIVVIDEETQHNHLDFLYVNVNQHNKGLGKKIWFEIEKLHPQTKIWETNTPYFDKRNIHFYVNICEFEIVEYFNKKHPNPDELLEEMPDIEYFEDFFRFKKNVNRNQDSYFFRRINRSADFPKK